MENWITGILSGLISSVVSAILIYIFNKLYTWNIKDKLRYSMSNILKYDRINTENSCIEIRKEIIKSLLLVKRLNFLRHEGYRKFIITILSIMDFKSNRIFSLAESIYVLINKNELHLEETDIEDIVEAYKGFTDLKYQILEFKKVDCLTLDEMKKFIYKYNRTVIND